MQSFFSKLKKIGSILMVVGFFTLTISPAVSVGAATTQEALDRVRTQASNLPQLGSSNPQQIIGMAIKFLMGFMGTIMFVLMVYSGFLWMTAQGNGEKIDKAKNIMVWSALGIAVMMVSYIVVQFVFDSIQNGAK